MKRYIGLVLVGVALLVALPVASSADLTCVANVSPANSPQLPATGDGIQSSFAVTSGELCYWAPVVTYPGTGPADWIFIESYDWERGFPGGVTYSVLPNPGDARTGYITVGGQTHTVTQAGSCQVTLGDPLGGLGDNPFGTDNLYVVSTECLSIGELTAEYLPRSKVQESSYQGLVYGPDEQLYAADRARGVYVIDPDTGTESGPIYGAGEDFKPKYLRFDHKGDLFVTNNAGPEVYVFKDAVAGAPTELTAPGNGTLEGITFSANGDVLVADSTNNTIWRFLFDPVSGGYTEVQPLDDNPGFDLSLTRPTGIARTSDQKVLVGDGNILYRISVDEHGDASDQRPCQVFASDSVIQDVDISADDTLYVSVWDKATDVGELYQIPADSMCDESTPQQLATFSGIAGTSTVPPLTGVAVPFWRQQGHDASFPNLGADTQAVSFNDMVYEFTPEYTADFNPDTPDLDAPCKVEITAREISPNDPLVLTAITEIRSQGAVGDARPIVNFGDNGRLQVFDYKAVDPTPCVTTSVESQTSAYVETFEHAINAYYSALNPQIVICHGDNGLESGQFDCELAKFKAYSPQFGFLPHDGRIGGFDPRFSSAFLIDATPENQNYQGQFCGFQSPLGNFTYPDDPAVPEFNTGSDMPVKFTVAKAAGSCQNGPFVTTGIVAILSLARVEPDFDLIDHPDITGGGSFDDGTGRIVFDDPQNKNKPFALQIKLSEDGTGLPPGTYQVVVTDDTAATEESSTYYFPVQVTYFRVK